MQELAAFIKKYPTTRYQKGQVIFSSGDTIDTILIVTSGFVKVAATDGLDNEQMLWIAGRLDIVPTEQLFSRTASLVFSYTALSPLTVYRVKRVDFIEFANTTPAVMREIARGMSGHYDDLLYRLSSITQASAREKLAYTLCNIAERFSASDTIDLVEVGLSITHHDIAGLIHTSRETASIELKKLKDEGVIFYDRTHFIIHLARLREILWTSPEAG